jgi:hypothetical protein
MRHNLARCFSAVFGAMLLLCAAAAPAQTTDGIVTGRVKVRNTGEPLAGATVTYANLDSKRSGSTATNATGYYSLLFLPPGRYRVGAVANGYHSQFLQELEVAVGARIELNFPLLPIGSRRENGSPGAVALPGRKEVVNFFGPDVDFATPLGLLSAAVPIEPPSLSFVIDSDLINDLPLRGRNVYSLLLTVPGATSDSTSPLGLGLAINGQRPTSSNFLLDGVDNNDLVNSGVSLTTPPEAVAAYRVSTADFSAEFGQASGYVANVITRSGTNDFHGILYSYLNNDILNANSFQDNFQRFTRRATREFYNGFSVAGPVWKNRLFFSSALEFYRLRGDLDPEQDYLPNSSLLPNGIGSQLLKQFPLSVPVPASNNLSVQTSVTPPSADNRLSLLERLDYQSPASRSHLSLRVSLDRDTQPDFEFSPYQGFSSASHAYETGATLNYVASLRPTLTNDLRAGWENETQSIDRAHPEIPTLESEDGTILPGSPSLGAYQTRTNIWSAADTLLWVSGRHVLTFGGGLEIVPYSYLDSYLEYGLVQFKSIQDFGNDNPLDFITSAEYTPQNGLLQLPNGNVLQPVYERKYRDNQFFGFVQDNFKVTSRLGLSLGVRYDSFGALKNIGAQNTLFELGPGNGIQTQIANSTLTPHFEANLFPPDRGNLAPRIGLSYDLFGTGNTVFRAAYGIFYDRIPFALVQDVQFNDYGVDVVPSFLLPVNYLDLTQQLMSASQGFPANVAVYWIQQNLKTPYAETWFAGVQHQVSRAATFELNYTGSESHRLLVNDLLNQSVGSAGAPNQSLPLVNYRSNAGASSFNALEGLFRYRATNLQLQLSYTLSHSIDDQSDPTLGQFNCSNCGGFSGLLPNAPLVATFNQQFDSHGDRGNSDFDQRNNFVFYSIYETPSLPGSRFWNHFLHGWQISGLGAFRSGFPFTPLAFSSNTGLLVRPDLILPNDAVVNQPMPGGRQLLNPNAFSAPSGNVGTLGRNALFGPGFWSIDSSVARTFWLPFLGEGPRLQFRADFFNAFNHTNLSPLAISSSNAGGLLVGANTFGMACFGGPCPGQSFPIASTSPLVTPLSQTPRQIQLQVKLIF